ncbi:MAG: hypothetical protein WA192_11700 [Candidatus Acidiferrales bacterium]
MRRLRIFDEWAMEWFKRGFNEWDSSSARSESSNLMFSTRFDGKPGTRRAD